MAPAWPKLGVDDRLACLACQTPAHGQESLGLKQKGKEKLGKVVSDSGRRTVVEEVPAAIDPDATIKQLWGGLARGVDWIYS